MNSLIHNERRRAELELLEAMLDSGKAEFERKAIFASSTEILCISVGEARLQLTLFPKLFSSTMDYTLQGESLPKEIQERVEWCLFNWNLRQVDDIRRLTQQIKNEFGY